MTKKLTKGVKAAIRARLDSSMADNDSANNVRTATVIDQADLVRYLDIVEWDACVIASLRTMTSHDVMVAVWQGLDIADGVALADRVADRVRVGKVLTSPMGMASRLGMRGMLRTAFVGHLAERYSAMGVAVDARVRVTDITDYREAKAFHNSRIGKA